VTRALEILFYHLQNATLEQSLPALLEKTLQRGWRAAVRVGSEERLKALDDHLWTYAEDSFLPHAVEGDPGAADQPILLTRSDIRPNGAEVAFAVDGCGLPSTDGWTRVVLMFDGNDEEAVAKARGAWRAAAAAGAEATYWRQDDSGRWAKQG
jgi:DNA polymerase III subunit chi